MNTKIVRSFVCLISLTAAAAALTGCNKNESAQPTTTTGQYVDDKTLNAQVQTALTENPDYKFGDVKVAVNGGTVQLSGFVNTTDQKTKAGDIAKGVPGSKEVQNNISLKPTTP